MTNDRELLELAAKAAGYAIQTLETLYPGHPDEQCPEGEVAALIDDEWEWFNPLIDDGDALRLAVKLRLDVSVNLYFVQVWGADFNVREANDNDPYAATRRAIVRAAAEIGKEQP